MFFGNHKSAKILDIAIYSPIFTMVIALYSPWWKHSVTSMWNFQRSSAIVAKRMQLWFQNSLSVDAELGLESVPEPKLDSSCHLDPQNS